MQSAFLWEREGLYVDPLGIPADAPKARAVFITHAHPDHFSLADIKRVMTPDTLFVVPLDVADTLQGEVGRMIVVSPGDAIEAVGLSVDAVPAYNVQPRTNHPKEKNWVGYVIAVDGVRYYHAGDTDLIPEMGPISCDVAMLPIGGTFTMDVKEAAEAARVLNPKIVVPMHYGYFAGTAGDAKALAEALKDVPVAQLEPVVPFRNPS
ncbi:MAG: MBL fold metallo-hydrolase [Acidimicrobiia bacterium]